MAQNEGPFSKGERLTAVKLNDLAVGRPMTVAGHGVVNRSGGRDAIEIHKAEVIYIRLTEKDVSKTPIRYGWKEVDRLGNPTTTVSATWGNMTDRKAKMTDDYAIELNNQNLSVTDNYIYRAERSPATGEWLFFLRKKQGTPIVLSLSIGTKFSGCEPEPILVKDGMRAWGASAPAWYRIKSSTLRWKDYDGNWTTLQTWESLTEAEPSSYTFNAPYVPSATQPITFEYSAVTTEGTILGKEESICNPVNTCLGAVYPDPWRAGYGSVDGLFGIMTSGCKPGVSIVTSPPGMAVAVKALMTASGHAINNPDFIPVPSAYTGITGIGGEYAALYAVPINIPGRSESFAITYTAYKEFFPPKTSPSVKYIIQLGFVRYESSTTQNVWPDKNLYYIPKCTSEVINGFAGGGAFRFGKSWLDYNGGHITYVPRTVTDALSLATQTYTPEATC